MRKTIQLLTLLGLLSVLPTARMYGETMGTNPRPRPAITMSTIVEAITFTVLSFMGLYK